MGESWLEQLETAAARNAKVRAAIGREAPSVQSVVAAVIEALGIEQIGAAWPEQRVGDVTGRLVWDDRAYREYIMRGAGVVPVFSFGVLSPPNTRSQS